MPQLFLPQDFGARDARITCQTYSPVRRIEHLPPEDFVHYWRDVHAPLCSRLAGLDFYVQHHFTRTPPANLWPLASGVKPMDLVLDGAVELGFADVAGQDAFIAASPILFGDELNLFGHDLAYALPNGSKTYVDRQADGAPNGPDRLHRLHVHFNGGPGKAFADWAQDLAGHLAAAPEVLKLRLHLPEVYDNDAPSPPSPGVDHYADETRTSLAVMEIGFETALSARTFHESPYFQATLSGQAEHVRHLGVFLVTGVFTFVREGKPTLAGLRGSRAAEIIERLGATNHVAADVKRLFVTG